MGVYASLTGAKEKIFLEFAFSCDPANADLFDWRGLAQIHDLQEAPGVRVKNLEKVQEIHLRGYESGLKENGFWLRNMVSVAREGRV